MKKTAFSVLAFWCVSLWLTAQTTFQKRIELENPDIPGLIVQLPNGNYIVSGIGLGYSSADFIQITCLSNDGDVVWGNKYKSAFGSFFVQDLAVNSNNEVVILYLTYTDTANFEYYDTPALMKIDANGELIWDIRLGEQEGSYSFLQDVIDIPGSGCLVGYDGYHGINPANSDIRLARVDEGGGIVWAKQYDTGSFDTYFDLSRTSVGNYLLCYSISFHPSLPDGCFLQWLDPSGNPISNFSYNDFYILSIDEFSNGDFLLVGSNNDGKNIFARINNQGQPIWAKSLKAIGTGLSRGLVTSNDKILLNLSSSGGSRPLLLLDGNGSLEWSRTDLGNYGGINEIANTLDGGFACIASTLGPNGKTAMYVQKLDANGQVTGCETVLPCIEIVDINLEPGPTISLNFTDVVIDTSLYGVSYPLAVTAEDYCEPLVLPQPAFTATDTICVGDCFLPSDLQQQTADTWQWSFSGMSPSNASSQDPGEVCATNAGSFELKQVISYAGCLDSFSLTITVLPLPHLDLGPDTVLCEGNSFQLDATMTNMVGYLWEDQSTEPIRTVTQSGIYTVSAASSHCTAVDSVAISFFSEKYPPGSLDLGLDTSLCQDKSILLNATVPGILDYLWNDGARDSNRQVTESGYYSVMASFLHCSLTDEINVEFINCERCIYVPNVFSPNDDGINDVFEVYGKDVELLSLKIFNRWGGLAFASNKNQFKWDGTTTGKAAQPGVYSYLLEYYDQLKSSRHLLAGDVLLVK